MKTSEITRLIGVLIIGFLVGSGTTPLHAEDPVAATGEILKVCIDTKSGVIRVATECTKTERKTVLGGVGATGEKGDTGAVGTTGETGGTGATGMQGPAGTNGINGAVGERGLQGEKGTTGATGVQGPQGFTGATGSLSGLRTVTLDYLSGSSWDCRGFGSFATVVGGVSVGYSGSLRVSNTTISGCSVRVYAP